MPVKDHIRIKAGLDEYPIIFSKFKSDLTPIIGAGGRAALVSNPTVFALHGRPLMERILAGNLEVTPIIMGDGERYKSQKTVNLLHDHLFDIRMGRRDTLIAFGGGVVGDTAGMAAATYMRGLRFIQVPTTLLAMVDSSIGGKVGINHRLGKNLIGAFYQPRAVLVNPDWLATLGQREMVEGMAEIIKVGFLSSKTFLRKALTYNFETRSGQQAHLMELIRRAAAFKAGIVSRDACDSGIRAILNFGHTFGHAIEKAEGPKRFHHGEAVLAGMVGALHLSRAVGRLSRKSLMKYLEMLREPVSYLAPLKREVGDYLLPMYVDKKSDNGRLRFVLLEDIGRPVVQAVNSKSRVLEAIGFMKDFVNGRV